MNNQRMDELAITPERIFTGKRTTTATAYKNLRKCRTKAKIGEKFNEHKKATYKGIKISWEK
jgi:hypothetical protein